MAAFLGLGPAAAGDPVVSVDPPSGILMAFVEDPGNAADTSVGAALLAGGRAEEAEVVYWNDLAKNQENGFALYGLIQAHEAQGDEAGAAAARKRFEAA